MPPFADEIPLPGPHIFDPSRSRWAPAPADSAPPGAPIDTFTLATWNVWFGDHEFAARRDALLAELASHGPDIVCLQEVTAPFLQALCAAPWIRERYALSDTRGTTLGDYGVLLLARLPLRDVRVLPLPSSMDRTLVHAAVDLGAGRSVRVGAVHLESRRHNADTRGEQLTLALARLRAGDGDALLAGDFNFDAAWRAENARIEPDYRDVWPALRGGAPGYTEDTDVNRMRLHVTGKEKQVRFDRVLVRSPARRIRPASIALLGTAPVAPARPDVFPSDHFGLLARFTLAPPDERAP